MYHLFRFISNQQKYFVVIPFAKNVLKTGLHNRIKCPICRQKFNLEINHNYNTRRNYHLQNKENILNKIREIFKRLYMVNYVDNEEKIIQFDKIFQYIYDNKSLLKYETFKKVVLEKIDYLKNEGEFIGYYWSQKIY